MITNYFIPGFIQKVLSLFTCFLIIFSITGCSDGQVAADDPAPYRDTSDLVLTDHVKCRMDCREITINEIKEVLTRGKLNKDKSGLGSQGDPTFAVEGYSSDKQHIRVVVAADEEELVVITCIDLEKEWPCDCD